MLTAKMLLLDSLRKKHFTGNLSRRHLCQISSKRLVMFNLSHQDLRRAGLEDKGMQCFLEQIKHLWYGTFTNENAEHLRGVWELRSSCQWL